MHVRSVVKSTLLFRRIQFPRNSTAHCKPRPCATMRICCRSFARKHVRNRLTLAIYCASAKLECDLDRSYTELCALLSSHAENPHTENSDCKTLLQNQTRHAKLCFEHTVKYKLTIRRCFPHSPMLDKLTEALGQSPEQH